MSTSSVIVISLLVLFIHQQLCEEICVHHKETYVICETEFPNENLTSGNFECDMLQVFGSSLEETGLNCSQEIPITYDDFQKYAKNIFVEGNDGEIQNILSSWFPEENNVNIVSMRNNSISKLEKSTFDLLKQLTNLDLGTNKLEEVPAGVFENCVLLEELKLNDNAIKVLGAFGSLPGLRHLDLRNNQITVIKADTFQQLVVLDVVHLDHNKISEIEPCAFCNLKLLTEIYLSDNMLLTLPINFTQGMARLSTLYIKNNFIATIEEEAFSEKDNVLRIMHLNNNKLTALSSNSFKNLKNLNTLNLENNLLNRIPADSFDGLDNVRFLFLGGNKLTFFTPEILEHLSKLPKLRKVFINNN